VFPPSSLEAEVFLGIGEEEKTLARWNFCLGFFSFFFSLFFAVNSTEIIEKLYLCPPPRTSGFGILSFTVYGEKFFLSFLRAERET
jgi:hypothetical protein